MALFHDDRRRLRYGGGILVLVLVDAMVGRNEKERRKNEKEKVKRSDPASWKKKIIFSSKSVGAYALVIIVFVVGA